MPNLMCFGLGYSASAAVIQLAASGWQVSGTARNEAGTAAIAAAGFSGLLFDGARPGSGVTEAIRQALHMLVSIPPGPAGDPTLACHGRDIEQAPALQRIVYLSTIGVYGDAGGGWVDETSPTNPGAERSRARLAAEEAWSGLGRATGRRIVILRLAGIYGPGRSALDSLRAGTARRIVKPGQVFNRIHVADVAASIVAALSNPDAHGIYNVCDDEPAPPQDVVAHAAGLLAVPPPPEVAFADAQLSPMAASFYAESKRARNDRLKAHLGVVLRYPDYRQGLAQILSEI